MKKFFLFLFTLSLSFVGVAQTLEYKTFIYTSNDLAAEIQQVNASQDATRRFGSDLLNATLNASKGIASGYVTGGNRKRRKHLDLSHQFGRRNEGLL